jgi:hypothetical protein
MLSDRKFIVTEWTENISSDLDHCRLSRTESFNSNCTTSRCAPAVYSALVQRTHAEKFNAISAVISPDDADLPTARCFWIIVVMTHRGTDRKISNNAL